MQVASIESLIATQTSYPYKVWLWLDEATKDQNIDNPYLEGLKEFVEVKYYSPTLVKESKRFRSVQYLFDTDKRLAFRADGFRLWALNEYGGFYFDLDMMFLRDMHNLLFGGEFVYAWEKQVYANNAILFFRKGSYINNYVAKKVKRIKSTQPWALFKYNDKNLRYLRLLHQSMFDPIWNDDSPDYPIHTFEEFFSKPVAIDNKDDIFPYSYGYHWHNNWKAEINEESLFAYLERCNKEIIRGRSYDNS